MPGLYQCPGGTGITQREIELAVRHHHLGASERWAPDKAPEPRLPDDRYRQVVRHLYADRQQDRDRRLVLSGAITPEDFFAAYGILELPRSNIRCHACVRRVRQYEHTHPELFQEPRRPAPTQKDAERKAQRAHNTHLLLTGWRALLGRSGHLRKPAEPDEQ
jgi:hypothetical protein